MGKPKRPADEQAPGELDGMHPSRRKRVKYTEEDAQLAKIYNDLADEVHSVRITAAGDLLKTLSKKSSDQDARLETAESRLIRGLCSGRKAARLGFSIALAEVFRLKFNANQAESDHKIELLPIIDKIVKLTTTEGNVSGQEKRDHLLGRRYAFQAVLQSDVALNKYLSDSQWLEFVYSVFDLANQKPWLRRECGAMIYEILVSPKAVNMDSTRLQAIINAASNKKLLRTPEGVGLWIAIREVSPKVTFPKGYWHHNDPLSSKERDMLSKILQENAVDEGSSTKQSGTRQTSPSFAWTVILNRLFQQEDENKFTKFWESTVASTMFSSSSSTERKSLGLQVFALAISTAPPSILSRAMHGNILRCILDQRATQQRYLFEAAKTPLNQMIARAKQEPRVADEFIRALLEKGAVGFDLQTKTKTVESLLQLADEGALTTVAMYIKATIWDQQREIGPEVDTRRQKLADLFLMMVRLHRHSVEALKKPTPYGTGEISWLQIILDFLAEFSYQHGHGLQSLFQLRLMSCLNCLLDIPLKQAVKAAGFVGRRVMEKASYPDKQYKRSKEAIESAEPCLSELEKAAARDSASRAFCLLFYLSILQVYGKDADAPAALEDLVACYRSKDDGTDSTTMLVELLLSFISKPSALFRKLAEQVFPTFAPDLTAESLQSLMDILAQNESLRGQQELFDQQGDDDKMEVEVSSDGEDGDEIDIDDISDVELINGKPATEASSDNEDDSDEDTGTSSDGEEVASDEDDEEAAFDKKLADALGTAGMDSDTDEDGSDMDDEQMIALEPHLTSIFKERQVKTSKKQEKKDARENIVNFKNRVLDLLMIYVKSQYANVLTLDLILPLTTLVRSTSNKPTAEKAFAVLKQYFEACNKNKSLPRLHDQEACFDVLAAVHAEMKEGGSKLHANACSRSSLFLSKVLVALNQNHYERIGGMYAKMQSEWYLDPISKIQGSVFTEWTSWSIATRKHS